MTTTRSGFSWSTRRGVRCVSALVLCLAILAPSPGATAQDAGCSSSTAEGYSLIVPDSIVLGDWFPVCGEGQEGDIVYIMVSDGTGPWETPYGPLCLDVPPIAVWPLEVGFGAVFCLDLFAPHDPSLDGVTAYFQAAVVTAHGDPAVVLTNVDAAMAVDMQQASHCLAFDGIDDVVSVARSPALEPDEITVELWARLDGPQDWNSRLLRKGEHDAYFISADQGHDKHMQLLVTKGTTVQFSAEDTQPHDAYIGAWHHFLGVYAGDHAEFWVDGVQVSHVTHDLGRLTHLPLTDLCIGAGLPVTLQNEYFAGCIDEVRIWNYPRSHAQIQATWHTDVRPDEPGLVAYWRFDEGDGQSAHDASSYGHDGVLGTSQEDEPGDPLWVDLEAPIDR